MSIGKQYAQAMILYPKEDWGGHLDLLEKIVETPIFMKQYNNPFVSDAVVYDLIQSCTKKLTPAQKNLTKLLVRNKRLNHIKDIKEGLKMCNLNARNQQLVQITTASPPSPPLKKKLEQYAKAYASSDKKLVFEYYEKANIVGGFSLTIDGYVINKSIKSRLKAIEYTR